MKNKLLEMELHSRIIRIDIDKERIAGKPLAEISMFDHILLDKQLLEDYTEHHIDLYGTILDKIAFAVLKRLNKYIYR